MTAAIVGYSVRVKVVNERLLAALLRRGKEVVSCVPTFQVGMPKGGQATLYMWSFCCKSVPVFNIRDRTRQLRQSCRDVRVDEQSPVALQ
jgi:hypothetical protein